MERHVVVGAGPAGLTAAWRLTALGERVVVLEADPSSVGGLARTLEYKGHRHDLGPHRFYTKSDEVRRVWREMLPDDFVTVRRLTRIYYRKRFFPYPLSFWPTLRGIGPLTSLGVAASYVRSRLRPRRPELSFEDWVVNRFGHALYAAFFKTYTEKVWGMPCSEISKDWAAQRIRGLSLASALRGALFPSRRNGVTSLIDSFLYPRRGAGQVWEAVRDRIVARGGAVEHGKDVVTLDHGGGTMACVRTADGSCYEGTHFHLTMTLRALVNALRPPPPPQVLAAGNALRHRDFMSVALIVEQRRLFPDQWVYVHDPEVAVARITNYRNWSSEMAPAGSTTSAVSMEYFCNRGDRLWSMDDAAVLAEAAAELREIGLSDGSRPPDGKVTRVLDAYPVYDGRYAEHRRVLKDWIAANLRNVHPAGRKGLHNYNSQDHAMMTALLSVRNAHEGTKFDVWSVNTDQEYAEEGKGDPALEERLVPRQVARA